MPIPALRVAGGAANNDTLMQFQAAILGIPIARAANLATTAMGAAFFAGLATGFWNSTEALHAIVCVGCRLAPTMDVSDRESLTVRWKLPVAATQQTCHTSCLH